ncbi:MAG: FAD:protein FMN transferase [Proteobacteria bacterium]|nr:MAG: FAD:protein FMN transferase [Pseudomonadota bacterium]
MTCTLQVLSPAKIYPAATSGLAFISCNDNGISFLVLRYVTDTTTSVITPPNTAVSSLSCVTSGKWKNARQSERPAIAKALSQSGYRNLEAKLNPPSLKKLNPDLIIDLSGIAQGYSVDQIGELLEQKDIRNYLVEIGGELRGRGKNGGGTPWQVAVENPEVDSGLGNILRLDEASLSTSGNYRDFVDIQGIRYSHIFDPRVGRPIPSEFVSASVLTTDCTTADALAKAFLILSEPEQKALAAKLQLAVLLQKRVGKDFTSSRLGSFR